MWKSCMVAAQLFLMAHGSPSECQIDRICVCGECVVCVHDKGRKRVRDKWGGPRKEKWPDRLAWNKRKNKIAINAIVTVLCSSHMDIFQLDCHLSLYYMAEWDIYWYHSSLSGAEKKWRMLHGMNTLLRWEMPSVAADQSRCRDNRMANWPALPRMAISISMPAIQNINTIYLMSAQNITPDICNWFQ